MSAAILPRQAERPRTTSPNGTVANGRLLAGVNGSVSTIAVHGSDIYVGGDFTQAGAVPAHDIAKWNGKKWSALGAGVSDPTGVSIATIASAPGGVYVGGHFSRAGSVVAQNIAKWDGTNWSALGAGVDDLVASLAVQGKQSYVGGYFKHTGSTPLNHIGVWNGKRWSTLGKGTDGIVLALTLGETGLFATGYFANAGHTSVPDIARWMAPSGHLFRSQKSVGPALVSAGMTCLQRLCFLSLANSSSTDLPFTTIPRQTRHDSSRHPKAVS